MIAALGGLVVLDGWLSAGVSFEPEMTLGGGRAAIAVRSGLPVLLLVVLLVVLASYELGRLCQVGGHKPAAHWAAFVNAGLVVIPWIETQRRLAPEGALAPMVHVDASLTVVWLAGGALGACLAVLMRRTTEQAISRLSVTLLMILYLGLLASFAVRIRCVSPGPAGAALVVFFILTVKSGDMGAYFVGKSLGKNKLAPWVSPGKTIEGAFGAVALACLAAIGGMALWSRSADVLGSPPLGTAQAIVFGVVMAVSGLLGDLVESALKRDSGQKDSGQVIPAFGGLLDLIDSPLFAAPIAWWLLTTGPSIR